MAPEPSDTSEYLTVGVALLSGEGVITGYWRSLVPASEQVTTTGASTKRRYEVQCTERSFCGCLSHGAIGHG